MNDDEAGGDSAHTCVCGRAGGQVFHVLTSAADDLPRTWRRDRFWCRPHAPRPISASALHRPST